METQNNTPETTPKKSKDFIWLLLGMIGLILALILLKYLMTYFGLVS